MLEAKKSFWFERLFRVYNRNLIKRRFSSFKISNLCALENLTKRNLPLIIYANHSSWWDGLAAFQISETVGLDSFIMMEEKHLKRLFLFRRLGAFSVVRENPRQAVKSIEYAVNLLKTDFNKTLWIFPQGEILPNDARPIVFYNGLSRIIKKVKKCLTVPIAFRYEFTGEYKPEIFVKIGKTGKFDLNETFAVKKQTAIFANNLNILLDNLKSDVVSQKFNDYQNIL